MDTKIIVDMLENNASHQEVIERIQSGQDLKPEISQFAVVDPHFWYSPLRTLPEFENARREMREYPKAAFTYDVRCFWVIFDLPTQYLP